MASSSQVILSSSTDWLQWFQLIETAAVNADIWEYVDPSIKQDIIPTCTEPEEPTYRTVNPTATTFRDLKPLEREELRDLRSSFKRKYTIYREQKVLRLLLQIWSNGYRKPLTTSTITFSVGFILPIECLQPLKNGFLPLKKTAKET